jgi:hypothetical protein
MVALGATASVAKETKLISSEQRKIFISSRSGLHGEIIPIIIYVNATPHAGKRISSDRGGVIADYVKKFSDLVA